MPTFELQTPDGRTFQVEAPDMNAAASAMSGFAAGTPAPRGAAADVALAAPAGAASGLASVMTLPRAAYDITSDIGQGIGNFGRRMLGMPETPHMDGGVLGAGIRAATKAIGGEGAANAVDAAGNALYPSQPMLQGAARRGIDAIGAGGTVADVASGLYRPETMAGKLTKAGADAATSAALTGGGSLTNIGKYGVLPGVAGEAAGIATEGTSVEPYARVGASLAAGGAMAARDAYKSAPGRIYAEATKGVTDEQRTQAIKLQQQMARAGQPITAGEALDYVTKGQTGMGMVERQLTGSIGGGQKMADFYGKRAQASEAGMRDITSRVTGSGAGLDPSAAGEKFVAGAQKAMQEPIDRINKATKPYYDAAFNTPVDPERANALLKNQIIDDAMNAVVKNPDLKMLGNADIDQIGLWHKVQQELDRKIYQTDMSAPDVAAMKSARSKIDDMLRDASPDTFGRAQDAQANIRKNVVEPMQTRMIGQAADISPKGPDTVPRAIGAMIAPDGTTLASKSAGQVKELVSKVAKTQPDAARRIVGDIVGSEWASVKTPPNSQYKAATVARAIKGNPEKMARITSAIQALPNGGQEAAAGFQKLMGWFEIQGMRQPAGSQTAFNELYKEHMKNGGPLSLTNVVNARNLWAKTVEEFQYARNTGKLADLVTSPDGLAELAGLAKLNRNSPSFGFKAMQLINMTAPRGQDVAPAD